MPDGAARGGPASSGGLEFGPQQLFLAETSDRNRPLLRSAPDGSVPPMLRRGDGRIAENVRLRPVQPPPVSAPRPPGSSVPGWALVFADVAASVAGQAVAACIARWKSGRAQEELWRLLAHEAAKREAAEKRGAAERVARQAAEARVAELEAQRATPPPVDRREAASPAAPARCQEQTGRPPAARRFDLEPFRRAVAESLPG